MSLLSLLSQPLPPLEIALLKLLHSIPSFTVAGQLFITVHLDILESFVTDIFFLTLIFQNFARVTFLKSDHVIPPL